MKTDMTSRWKLTGRSSVAFSTLTGNVDFVPGIFDGQRRFAVGGWQNQVAVPLHLAFIGESGGGLGGDIQGDVIIPRGHNDESL